MSGIDEQKKTLTKELYCDACDKYYSEKDWCFIVDSCRECCGCD